MTDASTLSPATPMNRLAASASGQDARVAAVDFVALTKARSMLLILLATCQQTLLALEAAANALDTDMTDDLRRMIERSERELEALNEQLRSS